MKLLVATLVALTVWASPASSYSIPKKDTVVVLMAAGIAASLIYDTVEDKPVSP